MVVLLRRALFSFMMLCLVSVGGFSQYPFRIQVKTSSLNQAKVNFFLLDNRWIKEISKDSIIFKDNGFTIAGVLKQPGSIARFSTVYKGKYISVDFALDSGETRLNLDVLAQARPALSLSNLNSKSNALFLELRNIVQTHFKAAQQRSGKVNELLNHPELHEAMLNSQINFLKGYPNDFFSVLALYHLSHFSKERPYAQSILRALAGLGDTVRNSPLGKQLYVEKQQLLENLNSAQKGKKVLEFSIKELNGKIFNNASLAGQNYLLVFSAVWCAPCQEELPHLKRIYGNYKDKGLKVVYFNDDNNFEKWKAHVAKNQLDWINVSEGLSASERKITKSFGIYGIPACILVGKDGTILYNSDQEDIGLHQLEAHIKPLFD